MRNFVLILASFLVLNPDSAAFDVVSSELGNSAVEDSLLRTQYIDDVLHFTVDHQGILDSIAALSEAQGRTVAEGITNVFTLYDTLLAATAGGEDPTDSDDNTSDEFQSCGDSLTYNNYKYPTVEIGNDCWFAENLRTETDSTGATIPSGLSDTEWENATGAAFSVLDEGGNEEATNRETYGLLYNWYAVDAGLCPSGWHVATQSEFETIIDANGGASDAGEAMKSSDTDDPAWNGTNTTGFSGLKNARRRTTGEFNNFNDGYIWTSTNGGVKAKGLRLRSSENIADLDERFKENGFAVRCVQNADDAGDASGPPTGPPPGPQPPCSCSIPSFTDQVSCESAQGIWDCPE